MMAPAARRRATSAASWAALCPRRKRLPHRGGRPATSKLSLMVTGTPCSSPSDSPRMTAVSASPAAAPAGSGGLVVQHGDEGVDTGILGGDLRQVELDQFHGRNGAVAHHAGHEAQRTLYGHESIV